MIAPSRRLGSPTFAMAKGFEDSGQSGQWLTGVLEKHAANCVLLAPILSESGSASAITGILSALARRREKRLLVINCNPDLAISSSAFQGITFADLVEGMRRKQPRSGEQAQLVVSTNPFLDAESVGMRFEDLLGELSQALDMIVCVGSPLLAGPESLNIARVIPRIVVIAEAGKTTLPQLNRLQEIAKRESFVILGGILKQPKRQIPRWIERLFGWE